jgi:hypothetical protein
VLTLPTPLPPNWAGYPPHMSALDYPIWLKWAPAQRPRWSALYFDVGLGTGLPAPPAAGDRDRTMWQRLTQKRADVVADAGDHWELIELRHSAQANALGRLLQYQSLWNNDPPDSRHVALYLITDFLDPTLPTLLASHNITYTIV